MRSKLIWLGSGVLLGGAAMAWWLRSRRLPLPWSAWQPVLVERHGESEGRRLLQEAMAGWRQLQSAYPQPTPKPPLRAHLENIHTGLALYQVLLAEYQGDRQAALAEIEPLFQAWTRQLYGDLMRMYRHLPFPFFFFRLGLRAQMRGFTPDTWKTTWIEDSPQRIALDQYACPYVKELKRQGALELAPYFCRIDHWMAEMLPASIAFRRTQTQAEGSDHCDFRYEHIEPAQRRRR
jgi:hypothetical protein